MLLLYITWIGITLLKYIIYPFSLRLGSKKLYHKDVYNRTVNFVFYPPLFVIDYCIHFLRSPTIIKKTGSPKGA